MTGSRPRAGVALSLLVLTVASGCARHVVVERTAVEDHNDSEWTIHSEPSEPKKK